MIRGRSRGLSSPTKLGTPWASGHTDGREDVMYNTFNACNATLSARERLHAAISYSRPPGNVDPDTDPPSSIALTALTSLVL